MKIHRTTIRAATAVLGTAAVAGVAWIALPASAATTGVVSVVSSNVITYTAASGKANVVTLLRSGNTILVDDIYGISAGAGCVKVSGDVTRISCTPKVAPVWIRVDTGDGNDKIYNRTNLGTTVRAGTGNDLVTGGPTRDDIYLGLGTDTAESLGGDDIVRGEGGWDTIKGGDGNDEIQGGDGNDAVDGGNGNNYLYGGNNEDRLLSGSGEDYLSGDAGNDRLEGGNGENLLVGGVGNDTLVGGLEHDFLSGDAGNDVENGGGGDDYFDQTVEFAAGADADTFNGGDGNDIVFYIDRVKGVTADADSVTGDDGFSGEKDTISTSVEDIYGGEGNDRLIGTDRPEMLVGYGGNDTITGAAGDDSLLGYEGIDQLNGGDGYDICLDADEPGESAVDCELGSGALAARTAQAKGQEKADRVLREMKAEQQQIRR
ncbi:calcium-binding protein [Actinoplanes solisilvae]|uniref:calcium-binding protein n=1 Tax=Actinoplanes solisilvae TaxID=2486853 RepID=UPI000FDAB733|nr:calcium-binding protein [Actinoplanes solisilvae]